MDFAQTAVPHPADERRKVRANSRRRWLYLALAEARRLIPLMTDGRSASAVYTVESYLEGNKNHHQVVAAMRLAHEAYCERITDERESPVRWAAYELARATAAASAAAVGDNKTFGCYVGYTTEEYATVLAYDLRNIDRTVARILMSRPALRPVTVE